jgi:hypothetical protein
LHAWNSANKTKKDGFDDIEYIYIRMKESSRAGAGRHALKFRWIHWLRYNVCHLAQTSTGVFYKGIDSIPTMIPVGVGALLLGFEDFKSAIGNFVDRISGI